MLIVRFLFLALFCIGCKKCPEKVPPFTWEQLNGRDELIAYNYMIRRPVYRAKVPIAWKRKDHGSETALDTTKPIALYEIEEGVVLAVHSFPTECLEERIPPIAQVERWSRQMKDEIGHIEKTGHGGFSGLYFEGNNEQISVRAWSMQLDLEHYQHLRFIASTLEEEEHYKQMSADYTIKAIGPIALIEKHREEIDLFANSFELIQEIPPRT